MTDKETREPPEPNEDLECPSCGHSPLYAKEGDLCEQCHSNRYEER